MGVLYISLNDIVAEMEHRYRFKTNLGIRDLCNIFGYSRAQMYKHIRNGVFDKFGPVPTQSFSDKQQSVKIPKQVVFACYKAMFE